MMRELCHSNDNPQMPYGVKANVRAPHRFLRFGALCWLANTNSGSGNERFQVSGMSRDGRIVQTWIDARDLENFRAGWFPEGREGSKFPFDTREQAQEWAEAVAGAYSSDPVRPHAASFGRPETQKTAPPREG